MFVFRVHQLSVCKIIKQRSSLMYKGKIFIRINLFIGIFVTNIL